MDCKNYLAAVPVKNLIEGWNIQENKCSPGKISYFATKDISSPTGKSGSIDVAQIDITKGLALDTNLQFTFESFLALDKNSKNIITSVPSAVEVKVQEQPKVAVCGNGQKKNP